MHTISYPYLSQKYDFLRIYMFLAETGNNIFAIPSGYKLDIFLRGFEGETYL
jgi:hypothetical protein